MVRFADCRRPSLPRMPNAAMSKRKTTPSEGNFAKRVMATARNGRPRLIPLVRRLCFGTRLASGWTVAATEDAADAKTLFSITNHFPPITLRLRYLLSALRYRLFHPLYQNSGNASTNSAPINCGL
jgi:hypothetical protein